MATVENLTSMFNEIDKNGDGVLGLTEIKNGLLEKGFKEEDIEECLLVSTCIY